MGKYHTLHVGDKVLYIGTSSYLEGKMGFVVESYSNGRGRWVEDQYSETYIPVMFENRDAPYGAYRRNLVWVEPPQPVWEV